MAGVYYRAVGAVWRRIGDVCIVQFDGIDHTLVGGAAAVWVQLDGATPLASLVERLATDDEGPEVEQIEAVLGELFEHELVVTT